MIFRYTSMPRKKVALFKNSLWSCNKTGVLFIGEKPIAGTPSSRTNLLSVPPGKICCFSFSFLKTERFNTCRAGTNRVVHIVRGGFESRPERIAAVQFRHLDLRVLLLPLDVDSLPGLLAPFVHQRFELDDIDGRSDADIEHGRQQLRDDVRLHAALRNTKFSYGKVSRIRHESYSPVFHKDTRKIQIVYYVNND